VRRPEVAAKTEELVEDAYKMVVKPSGIGDGPRASSAASAAPATSTPSPKMEEHVPSPVELAVWLITCGRKVDQTAGFRRWATSRKLGPRTAPEWERLWGEFLSRPV
jgi:hypothetical protein